MKNRPIPTDSLARVITLRQVAEMLGFEGEHRIQKARRWLLRRGIACRTPTGRIYTTVLAVASLADQSLIAEWVRRDS